MRNETVVETSGVTLHAPHLIDLEVAQTLQRYVRKGDIDEERAQIALQHLAKAPGIRADIEVLD